MSAFAYLLTGSSLWNFALGTTFVLIPLYAYRLGFSGVALGALVALPALVQLVMRFAGGAVGDRWGERWILAWTYGTMLLAGPFFYFAHTFTQLLVAQLVLNLSRSTYWIGTQSMVSRLPGAINVQMGRLNASYNAAQILGTMSAGFIVVRWGYSAGFLILSLAGLLSLVSVLGLPGGVRTQRHARLPFWAQYGAIFRVRPIYLAMMCSFAGAQTNALSQSFYPVYLAEIGTAESGIGTLVAMRAIGAMATGLVLARFLSLPRVMHSTAVALAGMAIAVGATPWSPHAVFVGLMLFGFGLSHGVVELNYQLVGTRIGAVHGVSSTLAVAGLGWSIAYVTVPTVFGAFTELFGLAGAFHAWGLVLLALAGAAVAIHRWSEGTWPAVPAQTDASAD